jgi:2-polyprenyl-3-methyl-5-hydroxy-6-metoxy-1,4-benzoquinol methylase
MADDQIVKQQIEYYRSRAQEYDEWFLRQGRYDRGAEHRKEWINEIEQIEEALAASIHGGDVLELACGTGLWTRHLAKNNRTVVAVDASPEVIAINRQRVASDRVSYVTADIFDWKPAQKFDAVFFSFWLSHVPSDEFNPFWGKVHDALNPEGQVFFIDSLMEPTSTARDHGSLDNSGVSRRKLNDGREFQIVKIFYDPVQLHERLRNLGWSGFVRSSGRFFFYGSMTPQNANSASG